MNGLINLTGKINTCLQKPKALVDLLLRLAVANVFWKSGLNKIQSWDTTLMLFEYEYAVPLLSPVIAAYMATTLELVLPVLLALGLAGRYAALGLFALNIVAVVSYPDLSDSGLQFHVLWGLLLAVTVTRGAGYLAFDTIIERLWKHRQLQQTGNR
jgi:putative oxidoreductase